MTKAVSQDGITFRDFYIEGINHMGWFEGCTNVKLINVYDEGLLANAGTFMRDKSVYFLTCDNVTITDSFFYNNLFTSCIVTVKP